jgi:transcriptional antiterminator NusG
MLMQRRITMMHEGNEVDVTRGMEKIAKGVREMGEEATNRHAACVDRVYEKLWEARWYCLQIKKDCETSVENALRNSRIEAFMPRELLVEVRRGRKVERNIPCFPGYMLVRVVPSASAFLGLKSHDDVVDIVGSKSGSYHVFRDADVDVFRRFCEQTEAPRLAVDKTMKDGDRADIVMGPFVGFMCVVTSVKWCRQAKASVRIDVQGRSFDLASIPLAFLKKV